MKALLIILFFLKICLVFGQPVDLFVWPEIQKKGKTIKSFIPDQWKLIDSTSGDMNEDHKMDIAFVIESRDSLITFTHTSQLGEEIVVVDRKEKYPRRILAILFKDSLTDTFKLIEQSNTVILNHEDIQMNDPFQEIKIEKGLLRISYDDRVTNHINDNVYQYFFTYQGGTFLLTNVYWDIMNSSLQNTHSFDFVNKKWIRTEGIINSGQEHKKVYIDLYNVEIQTLKSFKRPFRWFVKEGFYL